MNAAWPPRLDWTLTIVGLIRGLSCSRGSQCFYVLLISSLPAVKERPQVPGFEEVGMLNAMIWALACFGVVAADIALSMVLFSVLDAVSVLTGYPIDNLDIQWF